MSRAGTRRRRARDHAAVIAAVALCVAAGACGSNVDPVTVARVNGVPAGGGAGAAGPAGADGSYAGPGTDAAPGAGGATDGSGGSGGSGGGSGGRDPAATSGGAGPDGGGPQGQPDRQPAPLAGTKAGSCAGFVNDQPGITADKIVVANASDISGPVPGLFESAQQATRAFAAYFNATDAICGHKLEVLALDSRADGGADQQAYAKACTDAFAAVGSMSSFDSGGAATAAECGIPDLRSTTVTPERRHCATCFAAQSVSPNLVPTSLPRYWVRTQPEATQHVALLYINVGAAKVNAQSFHKAWSDNGWKIDYFQGIDVSEFNYTPYVQQMEDRGIDFVVYMGPYQYTVRLQQAMKQQSFRPAVFLQDSTIYDQGYVDQAGDAGEGSYVYSTTALFDDYSIPEMKLYRDWLQRVSPGADPNYYGLYAWSATRLFVQQAAALGGRLDRKTLVERLRTVKDWTGNGVHAPQQVGTKATANCIRIFQLHSGTWRQVSPGRYLCAPLTDTKIGE